MNITVLCPHFAPDTAPTGVVMTRIVTELAGRGHRIDVITALPWYRTHAIEPGWTGSRVRVETTEWGSITRLDPFPGDDKRNLLRRAVGFAGFSVLALWRGLRGRRADVVLSMSPPLTNGIVGWLLRARLRGPLVFNIQDVFPDAAVVSGAITNTAVIRAARVVERWCYRRAAAVTVLSDDLAANVRAKLPSDQASRVHVIPNFVDTDTIRPGSRTTAWRAEMGFGDETIVMYAGNVGYSQSLGLMIDAARALPGIRFVINGDGAAKADLMATAADVGNVTFAPFQPIERLAEVLASGDIHVVPLKAGLAAVSVPSKTYSILAAGRPIVAAIDAGTAIPQLLDQSGAGMSVAPDSIEPFVAAIARLADDPRLAAAMGTAGRAWIEAAMSPATVAEAYEHLFETLRRRS